MHPDRSLATIDRPSSPTCTVTPSAGTSPTPAGETSRLSAASPRRAHRAVCPTQLSTQRNYAPFNPDLDAPSNEGGSAPLERKTNVLHASTCTPDQPNGWPEPNGNGLRGATWRRSANPAAPTQPTWPGVRPGQRGQQHPSRTAICNESGLAEDRRQSRHRSGGNTLRKEQIGDDVLQDDGRANAAHQRIGGQERRREAAACLVLAAARSQ
jgi:hypothetical protein